MHINLFLNVFKRSCNFHVNSLSKFDKQSSYRYMITKCMLSSTSHSNNIIVVLTSSLALKVKYLGKFLECHTTKVTRRTSCLNSFCFWWRKMERKIETMKKKLDSKLLYYMQSPKLRHLSISLYLQLHTCYRNKSIIFSKRSIYSYFYTKHDAIDDPFT